MTTSETIHLSKLHTVKLGVQGDEADAWLTEQGIEVPAHVFQVTRTAEGGRIVRMGGAEFMLESGTSHDSIVSLKNQLAAVDFKVYGIPRQESTFLLRGLHCHKLFAQTCGVDVTQQSADQVIFTRVAAVSCGIVSEAVGDGVQYRLWVDASYSDYLWNTLATIVEDLSGTCSCRPDPNLLPERSELAL